MQAQMRAQPMVCGAVVSGAATQGLCSNEVDSVVPAQFKLTSLLRGYTVATVSALLLSG